MRGRARAVRTAAEVRVQVLVDKAGGARGLRVAAVFDRVLHVGHLRGELLGVKLGDKRQRVYGVAREPASRHRVALDSLQIGDDFSR